MARIRIHAEKLGHEPGTDGLGAEGPCSQGVVPQRAGRILELARRERFLERGLFHMTVCHVDGDGDVRIAAVHQHYSAGTYHGCHIVDPEVVPGDNRRPMGGDDHNALVVRGIGAGIVLPH